MAVTVFEFGDFTLDCGRFELRRRERVLRLERKPMELLILLVARDGQLVARDEIAKTLWASEVFVDTEHGINTAIRKIRQVLDDDAEAPRFLQTVTGKGYRFIGTLKIAPDVEERASAADSSRNGIVEAAAAVEPAILIRSLEEKPHDGDPEPNLRRFPAYRWLLWVAAVATVAAVILTGSSSGRAIVGRIFHGRTPPLAVVKIDSLAVIPLDNLSGDPGQEYFADGMTDELITMLAKNSTLRVVSRTSVMQYKGAHRPLREIAKALGVEGILEGSISRSGDKVHMTIQLIEAASDAHVWAESYDRDLQDVASLPREAAVTIAKRLNSSAVSTASQRYVSPEAHDAYLRGRYIWVSGSNEEAGKYFKKATELQPDYALGWAGLSWYYSVVGLADLSSNLSWYYSVPGIGDVSSEKTYALAEAAATKAVELDDSLPEAHLALGSAIFFKRWDWARADQEVSRAIEQNPGFAEAYYFRSNMLTARNRDQEALDAVKKSMELDPFARPYALAAAYMDVRQYAAAVSEARIRLETYPGDPGLHDVLGDAYRRQGLWQEAVREWATSSELSGDKKSAEDLRRHFHGGDTKAMVRWQLSDLKKKSVSQYVSPVFLALLHAELGQREETLSLLEEGYRQHSPQLLWIQCDPAYDFLHEDERYRSIIRKVGLPPAW